MDEHRTGELLLLSICGTVQPEDPAFRAALKQAAKPLLCLRVAARLSARQAAERSGVSYGFYIALETGRASPLNAVGEWRSVALRIAEHWGELPEVLWPEAAQQMAAKAASALTLAETERLAPAASDEAMSVRELQDLIRRSLDLLASREAEVLRFRFGLDGEQEHTLEETGAAMGLTCERIRQIESKALRKLRHPSHSKYLRPFRGEP